MASLFFSYSHKDEALRDRLETHLVMLKREGLIETWHDRRLVAGDEFDHEISAELDGADVILLLVSPDFLASTYCYDREMQRAMERHEKSEAIVIPVILRPSDWKRSTPFRKLLATPTDGKPVTKFADLDDAFLDITTAIRDALGKKALPLQKKDTVFASTSSQAYSTKEFPRSSNMRVKKTFTDVDLDRFLNDTFGFLASFFESSLTELVKRNPQIEGLFKQIDANQFTAVAYADGRAVSRCRIFMDQRSYASGIAYSSSDRGDNSFNESISVKTDDQGMFLQTLGMSMRNANGRGRLTMEGAAEIYWDMFVEPLQR